MRSRFFLAWLCLLALLPVQAQQNSHPDLVALERCDRLLVVPVLVEHKPHYFLLDTGATTMLNTAAFPEGETKAINITSWNGTQDTRGRRVKVKSFSFNNNDFELRDLNLPAVDLSAIGNACGKPISGLLGVDLLEKLGASIDLSARVARLSAGVPKPMRPVFEEIQGNFLNFVELFNQGQLQQIIPCLDPEVYWLMPSGELRGRDAVAGHLRDLMAAKARMLLRFDPTRLRFAGDSYWIDFEYAIQKNDSSTWSKATIFGRKSNGIWQVTSLHSSKLPEPETAIQIAPK